MTKPMSPKRALPGPRDVLSRAALLLDLDGTLLDIAPTPDAVVLEPATARHLALLHKGLDGALAVVSGRRLDDIDRILAPLRLPAAVEHGALLRLHPDEEARRGPLPEPLPAWRDRAQDFVDARPGMLFEPKTVGFVLHFRRAPEHGEEARAFMESLAGENPAFEVLQASMAWEMRPRGVDKGVGVRALMAEPPFAGRMPVFIGDDDTDKDGIAAAEALGGMGFLVPDAFGGPAEVRAWLASLAEGLERGAG